MLLEGKKALVTGSRRGIGRGIATLLAKEGADVGINDIERDKAAEDTLRMVRNEGRRTSWHLADISDSKQVNAMFDEFLAEHGRIDILVNNAVASRKRSFLEISEEDWDFEVGNALKGYFLCSQRAAREMVRQGQGGRIVSISSVHAYRAWPNDLVYGVCKAGLVRMSMSMALDLAGHNVNCNCVAPGYIDSRTLPPEQERLRAGPGYADEARAKWIPSRRGGVPDDIARAVLFLCSPLGDYVNGQCIVVDGGFLSGGTPAS
jgi:NAD(P)-dependent dehydrogenase (short-subunit alcohol dehydrogenase family)